MTGSVSVALATYNGARFLPAQLASLAAQTHLPAELVVCDDQSSDATIAVLEDFARAAPFPVRIHRNPERLHFGGNFLKAAGLCSGAYVAFCDQDDRWRADKIARSVAALADPTTVLCVHDATKIDAADRVIGRHSHPVVGDRIPGWTLDPWTVFPGFTCTFRRELLDLLPAGQRPFDIIEPRHAMSHDRWVCYLASLAGTIAYLHEPLADWRQHGVNASGRMREARGPAALRTALLDKFGFYLQKRLAIVARLRALADALELPSGWSQDNLDRARAAWRRQEHNYAMRLAIATDGRVGRGRALLRAWRADAYRDPLTGRQSRRELVQDIAGAAAARPGQLARAARELPPVDPASSYRT